MVAPTATPTRFDGRIRSRMVALCAALVALPLGCTLTGRPGTREGAVHPVAPTPSRTAEIQPVHFSVAQAPVKAPEQHPHEEALPSPRGLPGMTLDQAINECLVADPRIRAGLESINQANADALSASLKPNPVLFNDIQLLPLTRPFTATAQGGPPQQDVLLSYPIDWFLFGKRAAAMASSGLGVKVSEAEYADLVRQRVTEAAVAFFDLAEAKGLRDIARQDLKSLEGVEAGIRKALKAGGKPPPEPNRIRLDVLKSQQSLREAEAAVVTARARLRALLGRADADPLFDIRAGLDLPSRPPTPSVEKVFALAVQNRPDLEALRWKVSQSRANIEVERRKGLPEVSPALGYTRQYQQQAIGFPDASSWGGALTVTLPVHNRNQGNRAKAASLAVQNELNLRAREVSLRAEIETIIQEMLTARLNAEAVGHEQLQLATEVRDSINKSYEKDKGATLLDVLDAQRDYRETYSLYVTSRASYWRAWYKFSSAIGMQMVPCDRPSTEVSAPPGP